MNDPQTTSSSTPSTTSSSWSKLLRSDSPLSPVLALLLTIVFFAAAVQVHVGPDGQNNFVQVRTFRTILVKSSTVAVAALGMTLIIIAKGIDLSAGTAIALSATALAWSLREGYSIQAALGLGIGTGCLAGILNGALVSYLRLVPFCATLGTMGIYLGLGKYVGNDTTVRPGVEDVPGWLSTLLKPTPEHPWMIVSPGVWGMLLLALAVALMLRYSVFGRHVIAVGSNASTARLCGIDVKWTKLAVYALSGLLVGVAGMYHFARLSQGDPTSGTGMELRIIAAAVIGGASLDGGRGSVVGTIAGAIMMEVINTGSTMLDVKGGTNDVVLGLVLLAAFFFDRLRRWNEED